VTTSAPEAAATRDAVASQIAHRYLVNHLDADALVVSLIGLPEAELNGLIDHVFASVAASQGSNSARAAPAKKHHVTINKVSLALSQLKKMLTCIKVAIWS
jgi:hypothetical protein